MKLSILDQSPITSRQNAQQALQDSVKLAQVGETLGFTRYWIAEHHDLSGLACSAPEIMLGVIGAKTKSIRIGSGAILLPHYKPYKVAEVFNMLATLFPNRLDLGIGRAPGGSAEVTMALSDNFLENIRKMPDSLSELLQFIYNDFPEESMFSNVKASPLPTIPPEPWLLGTSEKSAKLAARNGIPYVFGQFMSEKDGTDIITTYIQDFKPTAHHKQPKTIITISVICADTTEEAEELALSSLISPILKANGKLTDGNLSVDEAKRYPLTEDEKEELQKSRDIMIAGSPSEVKQQLFAVAEKLQTDEIMISTITPCFSQRLRSYELIAKEFLF